MAFFLSASPGCLSPSLPVGLLPDSDLGSGCQERTGRVSLHPAPMISFFLLPHPCTSSTNTIRILRMALARRFLDPENPQ